MNLKLGFWRRNSNVEIEALSKEARVVAEEYQSLIRDLAQATGVKEWSLSIAEHADGSIAATLAGKDKVDDFRPAVSVQRVFRKPRTVEDAYHLAFTLREDLQGRGIADRVAQATLNVLDANKWSGVRLEANLDVGGYAWLRKGFLPARSGGKDHTAKTLSNALLDFVQWGRDSANEALIEKLRAQLKGMDIDQMKEFILSDEFREYKPLYLRAHYVASGDTSDPRVREAMVGRKPAPTSTPRAPTSTPRAPTSTPRAPTSTPRAQGLLLSDVSVQRQVLLERLKTAEVRKFTETLRQIDEHIRLALTSSRLTDFSRARLEAQLTGLKQTLEGDYRQYIAQLNADMEQIAGDAAAFEGETLRLYAPGADISVPAPQQVWASVNINPLTMNGASGAPLLQPFMEQWAVGDADMVTNVIRQGYLLGETNDQIIARVRGTAAARYTDGVLAKSRSHAETVTRTAIQHVANSARADTWAQNADIVDEYEWVSTLDSRTTPICRDRDGETYPVGRGPLPPAHPNCRSTTVAVIKGEFGRALREETERASVNGPVPANETYYDWLKRQSADFQDLALGPTRGKLFRDGGLSTEQFSALQLSKTFEPMTLEEMRRLKPKAFDKAGL